MKKLISAVLLAASFVAQAQVTPRNILATKYTPEAVQAALLPRAEWQPYPRSPEAWKQALPDSVLTRMVQAGETAARAEIPPISASLTLEYVRNGDRNRYQAASFGRRNRLLDLVLAESVEGKGRFADAILDQVWAICEESYWGVPAHLGVQKSGNGLPNVEDRTVDLFAAETAGVLALTDYFVGEKLAALSPLVRPRIYHETNVRLFDPLTQNPDRYGYLKKGAKVNNWNPWIMSNWLLSGLLLEKDENRRAAMTTAAMNGIDLYLNGLGDDGGTDEGPSYWFAAGACVFDGLELIHGATGGKVDVYAEPLIKNMASYVYKMHIAGPYFVDFADADVTLKPDGLMLYRFGQRLAEDTLSQFGRWAYQAYGGIPSNNGFHRMRRVSNLLAIPAIASAPAKPFQPVRGAWFPDVQVLTARSDGGLFLATHGGHNAESHNHNDVGDFILYADGQPVIVDVGRGTYTAKTFSSKRYELWWTQSNFHNLPIVNGVGQKEGRTFEARNVQETDTGKETTLAMDLAPAYPKEAGIQSWNRSLRLDRTKNALDLTDAYVFAAAPTSLQQAFMTTSDLDQTTPGRLIFKGTNHRPVELRYDPKAWRVAVEEIPLTTPDDQAFKTQWAGKPIQRVLLTATAPKASGKVSWRFGVL